MYYKYKKIVTKGANGTTIVHKQTEDNPIMTLGEINGYTYIYALQIGEQHEKLNFTKVSLTVDEIRELETQRFLKNPTDDVMVSMQYANVSATVQKMLDDEAKSLGYDDINSVIVYLGSPNETYNTEAISFRDWKSNVWTKVQDIQALAEQPATLEEFMSMLPERM